MSVNPFQVVRDFEAALCDYTGAKYAVTTNSCTMALLLAVKWHLRDWHAKKIIPASPDEMASGSLTVDDVHVAHRDRVRVEIPKRTYVSVPQSIIHAGGLPVFRDENWLGMYCLEPLPVWDSARYFTSSMFCSGTMQCVSFHASKTLGLEQGGAILHDDPEADAWFRRARFDGRTEGVAPKDDRFDMVGFHCYLNPSTAAQGILKLHSLSRHNEPLPNDDYPDLSKMEIFK